MKLSRINIVLILFLIVGLVIIGRLFQLQIIQAEQYKAWAKGQQEVFESPRQERGEIFLVDNIKAAANKDWYSCYAVPKEIKNVSETVAVLSSGLSMSAKDLEKDLADTTSSFSLLKKKLTEAEINFIKEKKLEGIYIQKDRYRSYPYQELASDVIGFVNNDMKGEYGIEKQFDKCLAGNAQWLKKQVSPYGYSLDEQDVTEKGCDIYLTIDKNIQTQAENLLAEAQKEFETEGGEIIVIDPNTGRTLALAENPSFDLNNYKDSKIEYFTNGSVQDLFEPGSMFKAITMASALNEKVITPETTYEDKGFVVLNGRKLTNFHGAIFGEVDMTTVLVKSINTGAVFAQSKIGNKTFLKYLEKFGIFDKTNVELPGEIASKNNVLKSGRDVNYATAAFGQGISLTPINLMRAFAVIANGGKLINLNIVDSTKEGESINKTQTKVLKENIIDKKALEQLAKMLVQVTETGYGKKARVPGYYIAGKTGTSQIPYSSLGIDKPGYSDKTWQSFIGFFPAFEPKFLMLVKLDNPNVSTAEYSAAPVFGKLAQYILNYYKIVPDYKP